MQQVLFELQFSLRGRAESSYSSAHVLLWVHLRQLLQNTQSWTAEHFIIKEDLYVGNHPRVPYKHCCSEEKKNI